MPPDKAPPGSACRRNRKHTVGIEGGETILEASDAPTCGRGVLRRSQRMATSVCGDLADEGGSDGEAASRSNCVDADVSRLFYDLTVTGSELSIKASSGETFSAPVAADGSVRASFTGSLGQNTYSLDLTGNVNTRDFEAFNERYSCRFKLIPVR